MTGMAAELCGDLTAVESLGYKVEKDGIILNESGNSFSKLGCRRALLSDLSPAATFIACNYNTPVNKTTFRSTSEQILTQLEAECGWMYLTLDRPKPSQITKAGELLKTHRADLRNTGNGLPWGRINYTIWSDVFVCPECTGEVVFWDAAIDKKAGEVLDEFHCSHCTARLTKRNMEWAFVTALDPALKCIVRMSKQVPVLIKYTVGKQRLEKTPDEFDLKLLAVLDSESESSWYPTDAIPKGDKTSDPFRIGITHVHMF